MVRLWAQFSPRQAKSEVLFWCAVALVIVVGVGLIGRWVVRRLRQPYEPYAGPVSGFDPVDLQNLHQQGHLTDEEYSRARAAVLARHRYAREHGPLDQLDAADVPQMPASADDSDKPHASPPDTGGDNPPREP